MPAKRILIVDDEENFAHIVKMNLEQSEDYHLHIETDSTNALNTALTVEPDVIILDIMMPGKDGFEVLEMLKKNKKTMSIPVIMLTALSDDDTKIKASEKYSEGYLTKPLDTKKLKAKIEEVLKRRYG